MTNYQKNEQQNLLQEAEDLFGRGKIEQSLACIEIALTINSNNWKAWNYKGLCLLKLKKYHDAGSCFEQSLEIGNNNAESWSCFGTYYFQLEKKDKAKKCFIQAEQLEGSEMSYSQLAYFYYSMQDFTKANFYIEKALTLNDKNQSALNTKGLVHVNNSEYLLAIDIFKYLIELKDDNSLYHGNLGHAYLSTNQFIDAEESLKKSLSLDEGNAYSHNNIAILYFKLKDYKNAWHHIDTATSINSNHKLFWTNKADILLEIITSGDNSFGNLKDVGYYAVQADISVIHIINQLKSEDIKLNELEKNRIICAMIDHDHFFNATTKDCLIHVENYLNIYKRSLEIVALLETSHIKELDFSHYTTQETANALIFQNSSFRLHSVATANDPKEGQPLLNFLGFNELNSPNIYQAFIGSFTFNPDSLNQFRLYGKNDNIEGSGVSLLLSYEYFADDASLNSGLISPQSVDIESKPKQSLFRCIYIDPKSKRVISVGHKEACVFYRENIGENKKDMNQKVDSYLQYINDVKNKVEEYLDILRQEIFTLYENVKDYPDLLNEIFTIIPSLLIHLRYLVKHYDFKEEQECRIIQVEELRRNMHINVTNDCSRMYLDYLPFHENDRSYLESVYFGPKTSNFELFKDRISHLGMDIYCIQNEHPFV